MLFALALMLGLPGASIAGEAGCSYDPATRTISITLEPAPINLQISRDYFDQIDFGGDAGINIECRERTVFEVDKIVVSGSHSAYDVLFDLRVGPLAPGHTNEPGNSDEIELELEFPDASSSHRLAVLGSTSPDRYIFGSSGINLNASESSGVDADVTVDLGDESTLRTDVFGGLGNDWLRGGGGSGTGAQFPHQLLAYGGLGNDLLEGSKFPGTMSPGVGDQLEGGRGRDTLTYERATGGVFVDLMEPDVQETFGAGIDGVAGIENLVGSPFKDVLEATNGKNAIKGIGDNDDLHGRAGNDNLNGGAANDECFGGPGTDTFANCETAQQGGT